MLKKYVLLTAFAAVFFSAPSFADPTVKDCTENTVSGIPLDMEFGPGSADATHCNKYRRQVKVVYQVNQYCDTYVGSVCTRAYGFHNVYNAVNDYEVAYGMTVGKDVEIAVVVHGGGGPLLIKGNPFENYIKGLMDRGVKIYMCQNTARSLISKGKLTEGYVKDQLIDGVQFVTSGVTAIPDFQNQGYAYIQP